MLEDEKVLGGGNESGFLVGLVSKWLKGVKLKEEKCRDRETGARRSKRGVNLTIPIEFEIQNCLPLPAPRRNCR